MARSTKKRGSRDVIRLEEFLPYRVARLDDRLLIKNSDLQVSRHRLTTQEWKVLSIVADHGPLTPAEIRRRSTQDKSTISWAIKRLEKRGFLVKKPAKGDGRTFQVALGKAGWTYYDAIVPKARALERAALKVLTRAELKEFRRLVEKLTPSADS
jgi:DNA-binding MarR family transcriptional regulator